MAPPENNRPDNLRRAGFPVARSDARLPHARARAGKGKRASRQACYKLQPPCPRGHGQGQARKEGRTVDDLMPLPARAGALLSGASKLPGLGCIILTGSYTKPSLEMIFLEEVP